MSLLTSAATEGEHGQAILVGIDGVAAVDVERQELGGKRCFPRAIRAGND